MFAIVIAVSVRSCSSGSGIDRNIPLFILLASNFQLDIPTKATLSSSFCSSYSNSACITFNGLCGDISARPISSKTINDIISSFSLFNDGSFNVCLAFSYNFSRPSDVLVLEPWYECTITLGYILKNGCDESPPFMELHNNLNAYDLLHPGLPHMNNGNLQLIQTNNANTFSSNALFFAIPLGSSILSNT